MKQPKQKAPLLPLMIGMVILAVTGGVFAIAFSQMSNLPTGEVPDELTADTYMETVNLLLENADIERGERMLQTHGCLSCHAGAAVQNNLAPGFDGLATRAATDRPPLTAAAFIYESIVNPNAYDSGDYVAVMPLTYGALPERDLGDMLAYLLTLEE